MLKNMKIGKKLIITFVITAIISSIAGVVGIVLLRQSDTSYSQTLVSYGFAQGDIGRLGQAFHEQRTMSLHMIASTTAQDVAIYKDKVIEIDKKIDELMTTVKGGLGSAKGQEVYASLEKSLKDYRYSREKAFNAHGGAPAEAYSIYENECTPLAESFSGIVDSMLNDKTSIGNESSVKLTAQTNRFVFIMIAVILVSLVVAILLAIVISRSIARPIGLCVDRLTALSQGDLGTEVPEINSKDETGMMLQALKTTVFELNNMVSDLSYHMTAIAAGNLTTEAKNEYAGDFIPIGKASKQIISSLNDAMSQINQAADQVSDGADQVSGGAQELSQGATEQASSVEELAATINDVTEQVKKNATNASQASVVVAQVGNEITSSNEKMQKLIIAMSDISNSSKEIGKVIKTIEDIAFQTNILALNAAVEAARAGAAGKGFAVVADEVRNLASKSAEAAKSTTALIENSIKAVENGTDLADETGKSLLLVVDNAKQVVITIDQISQASNEQAISINQVAEGVDQIASVVQNNSATAEQSAAASEELSGQAEMLKSLVARFQLKGQSNNYHAPSNRQEQPEEVGFDDSDFTNSGKY